MKILAVLAAILFLSAPALAGEIVGGAFTAEHPDSVAAGCSVSLIYRDAAGERQQIDKTTGEDGHFHFAGLSTSPDFSYVIQISYRGRSFLSAPVQFPAGEDVVEYSVLLSRETPAFGEMPSGHSDIPGATPPAARAARQSPAHTILIVLWIVAIFVLFAWMGRPRGESAPADRLSPQARSLVRDIAGLDLRHEDGVIGEEEYRKVRQGLIDRLRSMTSGRGA